MPGAQTRRVPAVAHSRTYHTSQKSARPKSALRRQKVGTVDRQDLDMTEGENLEQEFGQETASNMIDVESITSYGLDDIGNNVAGNRRLSMSSTSNRHCTMSRVNSKIDLIPTQRAQSATFSKEDEGFVNQQGVHELFADILFADPADLEDDNCSIASGVDEDMLFSRSRSIEEWEEELEERPRDIEQEINLVNTKTSATQNRNFHRQNSNRALRKLLSQSLTEDGTQQFMEEEANMMKRLLSRTSFDAEIEEARLEKQPKHRQLLLAYPVEDFFWVDDSEDFFWEDVNESTQEELQQASGLRVLRRLVQRQKSIEESDNILVKELIASCPNSAQSIRSSIENTKKKPPARLKPLLRRQ